MRNTFVTILALLVVALRLPIRVLIVINRAVLAGYHELEQTWIPTKSRRKRLVARGVAGLMMVAIVVVLLPSPSAQGLAQGDGMLIYGEGTVTTPRYSTFLNSTLGSELSAQTAAATIRHTRMEGATTRNEMIMGSQATTGALHIQRWNGSSWSSEWNVTVGDGNLPRFDIAYEKTSGDALVFYGANGTTNEIRYNRWNGSSWSGEQTYDAVRTSGIVTGLKARSARNGTTDDIALVWTDANQDLSANYWDGANNTLKTEPSAALETIVSFIGTTAGTTSQAFDLEFESSSGDLLITWGYHSTGSTGVTDIRYVTRAAGANGAWGSVTTNTNFLEEGTDLELAADPNSNYIGYANITDNGGDSDVAQWDGTGWIAGTYLQLDATSGTVAAGTKNITLAWARSGSTDTLFFFYEDSAATGIDWYQMAKGDTSVTVRGDKTNAPAAAADDKMLRVKRDPFNQAKLMLIQADSGSDLFVKEYDYDTDGWAMKEPGGVAVETSLSSITGFVADFEYNRYIPPSTFEQSAYRWFANLDGVSGFDTDGILDGITATISARAVTNDGTYTYIAGDDATPDGRIEKRSLSDGALDTNFGASGIVTQDAASSIPRAITNDGTYLYVAASDTGSNYRIEKRTLATGALCTAGNCGTAFDTDGIVFGDTASRLPFAIAIDGSYMYVAGDSDGFVWHIEKRLLSTGALDTNFGTNGIVTTAASINSATAIVQDSSYIYIGGKSANNWRLEKRLKSSGALCTAAACGTAFDTDGIVDGIAATNALQGLALDASYVYTVGSDDSANWRIEKRSIGTGALDNNFDTDGVVDGVTQSNIAYGIQADATHLYVAGTDASTNWRLEKRAISNGALDNNFDTDGVVDGVAASDEALAIDIDGSAMYAVGDNASGDWRTEKRSLTDGALYVAGVDVGAGLAALNTVATAPAQGTPFRLRMNLHVGNNDLAQSGQNFKLQYAGKGGGSCTTPTGTPSSYTDLSTSGSANAGTSANDASIGTATWSNPTDAQGGENDSWASSTVTSSVVSQYLKLTNLGFSVPATARVLGVTAEFDVHSTVNASGVRDNAVRLVKGGTIGTTDRSSPSTWPFSTDSLVSRGGSSDLWGETLTPADVNSSGFGVALSAKGVHASLQESALVDYVRVTVHYSDEKITPYNNSVATDGDGLTANVNDPVHGSDVLKRQTYEEVNSFTNSVSAISLGEDGMWDFALVDNSAPASTTYCFRAVTSDGSALATYTQRPEITTAGPIGPTVEEVMRHGNWFSAGTEQSAFWADLGL